MGLGTARAGWRLVVQGDQVVPRGWGGKEVQVEGQRSHCAGGCGGRGRGEGKGTGRGAKLEKGPSKLGWKRQGGRVSLEAPRPVCHRMRSAEMAPRVHTCAPPPGVRHAQPPIYNHRTSVESNLRGARE